MHDVRLGECFYIYTFCNDLDNYDLIKDLKPWSDSISIYSGTMRIRYMYTRAGPLYVVSCHFLCKGVAGETMVRLAPQFKWKVASPPLGLACHGAYVHTKGMVIITACLMSTVCCFMKRFIKHSENFMRCEKRIETVFPSAITPFLEIIKTAW